MILRSPAKDENGTSPALPQQDCHPEQSEGSALRFIPSKQKKQILRRCAPQNDIQKVPWGTDLRTKGRGASSPIFKGKTGNSGSRSLNVKL